MAVPRLLKPKVSFFPCHRKQPRWFRRRVSKASGGHTLKLAYGLVGTGVPHASDDTIIKTLIDNSRLGHRRNGGRRCGRCRTSEQQGYRASPDQLFQHMVFPPHLKQSEGAPRRLEVNPENCGTGLYFAGKARICAGPADIPPYARESAEARSVALRPSEGVLLPKGASHCWRPDSARN